MTDGELTTIKVIWEKVDSAQYRCRDFGVVGSTLLMSDVVLQNGSKFDTVGIPLYSVIAYFVKKGAK
jgi:hypothetical protein